MPKLDEDGFSVDQIGHLHEAAYVDGAMWDDDCTTLTFTNAQFEKFCKRLLWVGSRHGDLFPELREPTDEAS